MSCAVCQEEASEDCCEFREKDCAILSEIKTCLWVDSSTVVVTEFQRDLKDTVT